MTIDDEPATGRPLPVPAPRTPPDVPAQRHQPDGPDRLRTNPVRWRVIHRLALAGQRHAGHVLRRHATAATRPARHAVVFVFQQPARGVDDGLRIASRMFLDGADVDDLTTVLGALADRVSDYRRARTTHPLPMIIDRSESMIREARYLATMTSSLDPADLADGPATRRGWRGLAHLVDDTRLVLRNQLDPGVLVPAHADLDVAATHTLDTETPLFSRLRRWRYLTDSDFTSPSPSTPTGLAAAQTALERLHALITDSEHRSRHHRRTS